MFCTFIILGLFGHSTATSDTSQTDTIGSLYSKNEVQEALTKANNCDMQTEECVGKLASRSMYMVTAGGNTGCMSDAPYSFQVFPGSKRKVLMYFQGGGACWSAATCSEDALTAAVVAPTFQPAVGVFDTKNPENPYYGWTIIQASYCSGDVFVGNQTTTFEAAPALGVAEAYDVTFYGAANAVATLDYLFQGIDQGLLAPDALVLSGCSAGAIGAQLWYRYVMQEMGKRGMGTTQLALVADSFVGQMPKKAGSDIIKNVWGVCGVKEMMFSPSEQAACDGQTLDPIRVFRGSQEMYPLIPWVNVNSMRDTVQRTFSCAVGQWGAREEGYPVECSMAPLSFWTDIAHDFRYYGASGNANTLQWIEDGSTHCFTPRPSFYNEEWQGLRDMLKELPVPLATTVATECTDAVYLRELYSCAGLNGTSTACSGDGVGQCHPGSTCATTGNGVDEEVPPITPASARRRRRLMFGQHSDAAEGLCVV